MIKRPILNYKERGLVSAAMDEVVALMFCISATAGSARDVTLVLAQFVSETASVSIEKAENGRFCATIIDPYPHRMFLEFDTVARKVSVEGEWWFRGEFQVDIESRGCKIDYQIFNIAPGVSRFIVPFVTRNYAGVRSGAKTTLARLLKDLGRELHCQTRLLDERDLRADIQT